MRYLKSSILFAIPIAFALSLGAAPQQAEAGACAEISGVPNKRCITKRDLKGNAVTSGKVKNESLTGQDIKDGSIGAADLAPGAAGGSYVFVSFTAGSGAFGLANWDAACDLEADTHNLPVGVYRAWLSTSTQDAGDILPPGPYYLPSGQLVAISKADLLDGRIAHPIDERPDGTGGLVGGRPWTGTASDGTATVDTCTDWTTTAGNGTAGIIGPTTGGVWTNDVSITCTMNAALNCFQVQ